MQINVLLIRLCSCITSIVLKKDKEIMRGYDWVQYQAKYSPPALLMAFTISGFHSQSFSEQWGISALFNLLDPLSTRCLVDTIRVKPYLVYFSFHSQGRHCISLTGEISGHKHPRAFI